MPRLLRTLVSPYLLREGDKYNCEKVENMTDDEWNDAVVVRLQSSFEVVKSRNGEDFLVKLSPREKHPASGIAHTSHVGSGETLMEGLVVAVLQVLQSPDRNLLPYPHGISCPRVTKVYR